MKMTNTRASSRTASVCTFRQVAMWTAALVVFTLPFAACDIYMHNPRGSNNSLDEQNTNRNNANRLFDSQNNGKGGYRIGENTETPVDLEQAEQQGNNSPEKWEKLGRMVYMEGSILPVEWTAQHGCGDNPKVDCEIVLQYMCGFADDDALWDAPKTMTDGVKTGNNGQTDPPETGLQESNAYYEQCESRERNRGLFIADQDLRSSGGKDRSKATSTRQNPDGDRYGNECPEERDYYPYWHPSPWKDIAVLTSNEHTSEEKRAYYQKESQNVKGKNYCKDAPSANRKETCTAAGGTWTEHPAHGIPAPDVQDAPFSRENQLGNTPDGQPPSYQWMIPPPQEACGSASGCDLCVLRVRYNMTVGDYDGWNTFHAEKGPKFLCTVDPEQNVSEEACAAAGGEYELQWKYDGNPSRVDTPVEDNAFLNVGFRSALRMAYNTDQTGRTFEDRSHIFRIAPRSAYGIPNDCRRSNGNMMCDTTVYNLNIRGKRGNIVQVYPAVEYDFVPSHLEARKGDYVHVQWTGSNNNPKGNEGQGTAGTDRNNVVMIPNSRVNYPSPIEQVQQSAFFPHSSLTIAKTFAKRLALNGRDDVDPLLNTATPYFDAGVYQLEEEATYDYMCTRNNNFSNRSQKGQLVVR